MANKKIQNYSAKDVISLRPEEHLRDKPNLTFGEERGNETYPYSSMKTSAIREIIDNSAGERMIGVANRIEVTFHKDQSVTIKDNGRGLPLDISKSAFGEDVNGIYKTLGLLQSGSSLRNDDINRFSSSQNGVGASSANWLSEYMKVKVWKDDGYEYALDFKEGIPGLFDDKGNFKESKNKKELKKIKDSRAQKEKDLFPHGTEITLKLDPQYFYVPYSYDIEDLILRMKGIAYILPGLTFAIKNENLEDTDEKYYIEFYTEGGLEGLLENSEKKLSDFIQIKGESIFRESIGKGIDRKLIYDLVFQYNDKFEYENSSYVNTVMTSLGGVHVKAVEEVLVKVFNNRFKSLKNGLKNKEELTFKDIQEGLEFVISIHTNRPQFVGQEKQLLGGKELQNALEDALSTELLLWMSRSENLEIVEAIADKTITAMRNRIRIQEQKEINKQKRQLERTSRMPEKLLDCEITHSEISELFIAEGDSAVSGLKLGRSSTYQAIFPIRGKIINTLKASPKAILKNVEVQNIIKCLDAGSGKDYNHDNARYNKIIIACDADPDGANISNLLFTLMWTTFKDAVEKGCVYKMLTPLYEIITNKQTYYALNAKEKSEIEEQIKKNKEKIKKIIRMKGLGEGSPETIKITGMDPATRRIQRVTIEDIKKAEEYLEVVMGNNVEPRKEWLKNNPVEIEEIF